MASNRAADSHPRKRDLRAESLDRERRASMGPRSYLRGNTGTATTSPLIANMLQWGRGFTPAETETLPGGRVRGHVASMGRGLRSAESLHRGDQNQPALRASMGPRTCIRGKDSLKDQRCSLAVLLQWGRGLASAESWQTSFRGARFLVASMGPRTCIRGKGLPVTRCAATRRKPVCETHS
jgi:hypothetical protein